MKIDPRESKTFCSQAWNHQFVGPGGRSKPCCRFRWPEVPKTNHLDHYDRLEDLFKDQFMTEVREKMTKGEELDGCRRCYDEEKAGKRQSLRQYYNKHTHINEELDTDNPQIAYLELSFDNTCNIRCRMCEPLYSTNWRKDWKALTGKEPFGRLSLDPKKLKSVVPHLRHIKFTGGEPLLIKAYEELLEYAVELGVAKNIYLNYSTNLTIPASNKLIGLWEKFRYVEIAASLDGAGPVMEYVRFPTKWSDVEKVTEQMLSLSKVMDVRSGVRSTIMIYNILDLPNIESWWKGQVDAYASKEYGEKSWFNPAHLAFPDELSIRVLPEKDKELVKERLWDKGLTVKSRLAMNHLCNYMFHESKEHLLPEFRRRTMILDELRGENFAKLVPEFSHLIG